jgi:hypothetical protein
MARSNDGVVWRDAVDSGAWLCAVFEIENEPDKGWLCMWNGSNLDLVHRELIPVSYGKVFGPDADDIRVWQDRILDLIAKPYMRHINSGLRIF